MSLSSARFLFCFCIMTISNTCVIKRNGNKVPVKFDEILNRIESLCYDLNKDFVNPVVLAQKVISGLYDGVKTSELDEIAAETSFYMSTLHPDFQKLAYRLAMSNLSKQVLGADDHDYDHQFDENNYKPTKTFTDVTKQINDSSMMEHESLLDKHYVRFVELHGQRLNEIVQYSRNFSHVLTYHGLKGMMRSYLIKCPKSGRILETPQDMFMRVAIWIHMHTWSSLEVDHDEMMNYIDHDTLPLAVFNNIKRTYDGMSNGQFIHATPTLFNAGTANPQLSSCFLVTMHENDSIEGIYEVLGKCAQISKYAGGIGIDITPIRASGSHIHGTNGKSNGIVPMLRVFNETARYVDQGGGKRKGAFAVYLEPWHADIEAFLDLRKNNGKEEHRTRDLFTALWVPDLFMERVDSDGMWTLFCPTNVPGLHDAFGDKFKELYEKFESDSTIPKKTIKARTLFLNICEVQCETGMPYMLYKDACNLKSNHQHLGPLRLSNLCTEVLQFSSKQEIAVCNLASVCLPKCLDLIDETCSSSSNKYKFNFDTLDEIVQTLVRNLDKVITINQYTLNETELSNSKNRPMGIGVQGLADVFAILNLPFDSKEARELNSHIFEQMYYSAMKTSMELTFSYNPCSKIFDSPAVKDKRLQFDMWKPDADSVPMFISKEKWDELKESIHVNGLRNSLLIAPMPTASTSQIFGNTECFEPFASNLFVRRTLAGEFPSINDHLVKKLITLGLWDENMRNKLVAHNGSVQLIKEIPREVRDIYKTAFEISQRVLINMAADRGRFICQSQSLNLFCENITIAKLSSMHFYAWRKGLKTGMYYLRTKAAADAIKFTIDPKLMKDVTNLHLDAVHSNEQNNTLICESCSA